MNLDERIDEALDGSDALVLGDAYRNSVKQLIRDVLEYVEPEEVSAARIEEPWKNGHEYAIYQMEAKIKELGL